MGPPHLVTPPGRNARRGADPRLLVRRRPRRINICPWSRMGPVDVPRRGVVRRRVGNVPRLRVSTRRGDARCRSVRGGRIGKPHRATLHPRGRRQVMRRHESRGRATGSWNPSAWRVVRQPHDRDTVEQLRFADGPSETAPPHLALQSTLRPRARRRRPHEFGRYIRINNKHMTRLRFRRRPDVRAWGRAAEVRDRHRQEARSTRG